MVRAELTKVVPPVAVPISVVAHEGRISFLNGSDTRHWAKTGDVTIDTNNEKNIDNKNKF
jgi:hypothetical protein